jgi:lysophospholipase L1-like esterase
MRPASFLGITLGVLLGLAAAPLAAADDATATAPRPAATKPRPSTSEPLKYENCKSYDYPGRHAAILELKTKIDPQLILIGDSITHHWGGPPASRLRDGEKVLTTDLADYRTLNLGFGHDRTQHVIWRLQNGEIDGTKPDWVVIHIGTNNLNDRNTPAEIMAGIKAVCAEVEKRTPKARIVLMAVLPRQRQATHPLRKTLAELNALIAAHASERGYVHLDIGGRFLDDKGDIPKELMPDALHLSADGYRIWAKALREVFTGTPSP